ncbi:hypothetical protein BDR03DRAFT_869930, partial [Suillus americanus]
SQGRQLLHFTRNRLAPSTIRTFLCSGAWSRSDLLAIEDLLAPVRSAEGKSRSLPEDNKKFLLDCYQYSSW